MPFGVHGRSSGMRWARRPSVIRVETVDILVWTNALEQQRSVQVSRQWQLQQNAVDGWVVVEAVDQIG